MKITQLVCAIALVTFTVSSASALTTSDLLRSVVSRQEQEFASEFSALVGTNKQDPSGAYALVKYIVVPTKAKKFIEVLRTAKEEAQDFKGFKAYDVVKTVDDNITYYGWTAWENPEDLIEYVKSESSKKVIEFLDSEDIVDENKNALRWYGRLGFSVELSRGGIPHLHVPSLRISILGLSLFDI